MAEGTWSNHSYPEKMEQDERTPAEVILMSLMEEPDDLEEQNESSEEAQLAVNDEARGSTDGAMIPPLLWASFEHLPPPESSQSDIRIGDKVRVKPTVKTPKYKCGPVTDRSVGVVKALSANRDDVIVDLLQKSDWKGLLSEREQVPSVHPGVMCVGCEMYPITDPRVSENEREWMKESRTEEYNNNIQPSAITEQQEIEVDDEVAMECAEDMEQVYGESVVGGRSEVGDDNSNVESVSEMMMVVMEDDTLMPLNVLVKRPQKDPESHVKTERMGKYLTVTLERLDISNMDLLPLSRSVSYSPHPEKPKQCPECDQAFWTKLHKHMKVYHRLMGKHLTVTLERLDISNMDLPPPSRSVSHSPNPNKPHQCPECDQAFRRKSHFEKHIQVHHKGLKFPCSLCGKHLRSTSLTRHVMLIHNKAFRCSYQDCDKAYSTNLRLRKHTERHHSPNPKKPHQCPECDQAFWTKLHFEKHMKVHQGFPCSLCSKQLSNSTALEMHMLIHNDVKAFSCSYKDCNMVFRSKNEVLIHTRYHTGEQPFKCRHCGKGFVQSSHAASHELTHTQERPHICTICNKAFNTRYNLNTHRLIHTGEKPHVCPDCGKGFRVAHGLKFHKLKYH